ncbi:hypothetical protein ACEPAH_3254 [Sanghuangporus vaninii]
MNILSRRKPRHQSEPPPSRPSLESPSDSGDELDAVDNAKVLGVEGQADSTGRLLAVQTNKSASIAEKARAALETQPITSGGGKARKGTAAPSVAFPLTPTSAAGETTDRTMASLTAAAGASIATTSSEMQGWNKKSKNDGNSSNTSRTAANSPNARASEFQLQLPGQSAHKTSEPMSAPGSGIKDPSPEAPSKNNVSSQTITQRASPSHALAPSGPHPHANGASASSASAAPRTMSYRLENQTIRPRHVQDQHFHDSHYYGHPSPPPIATLTHSPSLSSDRSSVNSPAPTILPPLNHPNQFQPQPYVATSAHRYSTSAQPGAYHHPHYYPSTVSPPEVFNTPAQGYAHAYGGGYAPPPPPTHVPFHHTPDMSQYSVNPYATTGGMYGHAGHGGGSGGFTPIYTDDASTKLSDRVRRRCFNCCTTDTSTWRRSSLNPGKVLCNKCGLFERTHSRPRPDQFPHKRAPLQIPTQNIAHDAVSAAQSMNRSPQAQPQSAHVSNVTPNTLPPTPGHPSLGATYSHPSALPQIKEWLHPGSNSVPGAANHAAVGSSSTSSAASAGPSSRAHSSSSAGENRHHPYASSVPASGIGAGTSSNSGAGEARSIQDASARLTRRSDSVNSDVIGTPPPQHRSSQNLTPSPSPPPEGAQSGGSVSTQEPSPRLDPQSVSAGANSESGNQ